MRQPLRLGRVVYPRSLIALRSERGQARLPNLETLLLESSSAAAWRLHEDLIDHLSKLINSLSTNDPTRGEQRAGGKAFARTGHMRQCDLIGGGIKADAMGPRNLAGTR